MERQLMRDTIIVFTCTQITSLCVVDWLDAHTFGMEAAILCLNALFLLWLTRRLTS